jgi:membrane protease YdiL (CAAX protease family)
VVARSIYAPDREARGWQPWGALVPVLAIGFTVVAMEGVGRALVAAGLLDHDGTPTGYTGLVAFLLLPFLALGLVVLAWIRGVERRPLASVGLGSGTRSAKRPFVRGHAVGLAMASAVVVVAWAAGAFDGVAASVALRDPVGFARIAILLPCFALQSSVEEFVFRGWMLAAIAGKLGVAAAVVLVSLAFTLLHYDPGQDALFTANVFLFSLFACAWALDTGAIWGVMGFHAGWNWLLAVGFALPVTGLDAHVPALLVELVPVGTWMLTGGEHGPEGSVACTAVLGIGIAWVAVRHRRGRAGGSCDIGRSARVRKSAEDRRPK